ncbi:hypothetical protein CSOJ01_10596 [Colletotrichum sojae]|uniref:Peptidase A1 domain-containing protein n=1 Tax=Colletotrichum sojae TaxID=2175907 RepID=A0A8H6MP15_9PEZI|nr:hypothetical protein CSOJ01_10596 [Colletotrichum sojae]
MSLIDGAFDGWRAFLLLLLSVAFASTQAEAGCAPYPVALRAGNVSLSNGKVARGVEMAVGEPEQKFAFMPLFDRQSILLYSSETLQEGKRSKDGLVSFRGGSYDPIASKTRKASTLNTSLGDPEEPEVSSIADRMKLNDNVTLDDIEMGIAASDWDTQGYKPLMGFGLGTNSTLLRLLRASDRIASRSWGFFWGFGFGMPSQLDGSFVFGGYDRAKVTGERFTAKLTPNQPDCSTQLVVEVSDLTLNFPNGTGVSIFPRFKPRPVLRMCIAPYVPVLMSLPLLPYFDSWLRQTRQNLNMMEGGLGYYFWNQKYHQEHNAYDGGLTITLSSGLKISFSNEKLVVPYVEVDRQTGDTTTNTTTPVLLVTSLQGSSSSAMPYLGSQFLSAAYLQVNQDAGQFSLWKANPTTNEDLVAMDAADAEVPEFCTAAPGATAPGGTSPGDTHPTAPGGTFPGGTHPESDNGSLSKGAIAGLVVGAVACVAIFGGLAMWLLKRNEPTAAAKAPGQSTSAFDGKQDLNQQGTVPPVYENGSAEHHTAPVIYELGHESRSELP